MKVNTEKLVHELQLAGIPTYMNCNEAGIVWDDDNNEIQDRPDIAAILAAHDPTPVEKTAEVFSVPVVAPDFIVQSPKPKKDAKEAHARAIEISKMDDKSIAEIVLNMMVWQEDAEKRLNKAGI